MRFRLRVRHGSTMHIDGQGAARSQALLVDEAAAALLALRVAVVIGELTAFRLFLLAFAIGGRAVAWLLACAAQHFWAERLPNLERFDRGRLPP